MANADDPNIIVHNMTKHVLISKKLGEKGEKGSSGFAGSPGNTGKAGQKGVCIQYIQYLTMRCVQHAYYYEIYGITCIFNFIQVIPDSKVRKVQVVCQDSKVLKVKKESLVKM